MFTALSYLEQKDEIEPTNLQPTLSLKDRLDAAELSLCPEQWSRHEISMQVTRCSLKSPVTDRSLNSCQRKTQRRPQEFCAGRIPEPASRSALKSESPGAGAGHGEGQTNLDDVSSRAHKLKSSVDLSFICSER